MRKSPIIRAAAVLLLACAIRGHAAETDLGNDGGHDGRFELDPAGYVRHWIVVDPQVKAHYGGRTDSGDMPDQDIPAWKAEWPEEIGLGLTGPFGSPWRYYQADGNIFMEYDEKLTEPAVARMYAAVDLEAPQDLTVKARVWIGGWATLWVNEISLGSHHDSPKVIELPLHKGRNRFVALLRNGGLRGVHMTVGLQILDGRERLRVLLPGPLEASADFEHAERWLGMLEVAGSERVIASRPPPVSAVVRIEEEDHDWPMGRSEMALGSADVSRFRVELQIRGETLERQFEIPRNRPLVLPDPNSSPSQRRMDFLARLTERPISAHGYFLRGIVRRMLGQPPVSDSSLLDEALHRIDRRIDCADFDLAYAVRFIRLGAGTPEEHVRIRESALRFRHWQDEPGQDGMCFHSENHRLLFHGGQMICGQLWPDGIFTNSGLTGRQQADLGRRRCIEWLDEIERTGYEEFLSTTYAPITVGALMNLVDFADDPSIRERAARQMDKIYRMLAEHTFDGVMIGPQGRSYRYMFYPQNLGTQALLSWVTPLAVEASNSWAIFVASSPGYVPPADVERLMATPVSKTSREGYFLIELTKTPDYMLSSIEIPASAKEPSFTRQLVPGGRGYQQHIWHATLGRDCHVFTNHPGSSHDLTSSRPGFWAGSAIMPRQTQRGNVLMQIFSIPDTYPIQFTHAHWPTDAFDRQERREHWAFGQRGSGYIGLWCSTVPELRSEVFTNRELRAWGDRMAWVCICAGEKDAGSFETFAESCRLLDPRFDREQRTLSLEGQEPLRWDDGPTAGRK